ncbi:YcxB family protein [Actinoallomurus acaciae]|uniref:YcxB family protein n=1 Tax=Actinoallomurus acaciae TaxID=502577 RepID=A0ABV5YS59_9ACTN
MVDGSPTAGDVGAEHARAGEEPTLTLRYVPELDDIVELLAVSPARRRRRRRAVRYAVISTVLLCCVLWLNAAERMSGAAPATLFCALIAGTYLLRALAFYSRRGLCRRARDAWHRSPVLRQAHEERLTPESLTLRTDGMTQIFAWSRFAAFVETDRQFVLMDREGEPSIALPKRGLPDPSLVPVCRDLLTDRLEDARPRPGGTVASCG